MGKGSLRIVVEFEIQFGADFSRHINLYFLIKVKDVIIAASKRQRGIIDILVVKGKHQFRRTLQFKLHAPGTKDPVGRPDIELHVCNVELALIIMVHFGDFLLPIVMHNLLLRVASILLTIHNNRGSHINIPYLGVQDIVSCSGIVLHGGLGHLRTG